MIKVAVNLYLNSDSPNILAKTGHFRYLNHIGMCTYFGYDKKDPVQLALVYTDKTFPLISLVVLTASYTVFLIKVSRLSSKVD